MRTRSEPENRGNVKTLSKAFLLKWAFRQDLPPNTKYVLLAMINGADGNGVCRLSLNELAATTGLGRETVKRAVATLDGIQIERSSRRRGNGSTATSETKLKAHTEPRARTMVSLGGEAHCEPPIGNVDINSTRKDRLVLEDRYHLDNRPEYLGEGGSEGGVGPWWWGPADGPLLCNGYDDEVPA